tara:strand:- start:1959 stop:2642 length:684 start_codon:yes stop_codon:yes gene_type:complete
LRSSPQAPPRQGPRTELKVLLDADAAAILLARCSEQLQPDSHAADPELGVYQVDSVYFDTPALLACGDDDFPKYRSRRYDRAEPSTHFEEKYSHSPKVWKRRVACSAAEIDALSTTSSDLPGGLMWFQARVRQLELSPQLAVTYRRHAFHDGNGTRITFDDRIHVAVTSGGTDYAASNGGTLLNDQTVLELKFTGDEPALVTEILASVPDPAPFSKYRTGMRLLERI